jgi:hypothetical protein
MTPENFPQANSIFGPPEGMAESQVSQIHSYVGSVNGGSCDGAPVVITAWRPSPEELEVLNAGGLVYLSCLYALPPHFVGVNFQQCLSVA